MFLSLPIDVEEEKKYEIEEILDSRIHYGKLQYLVKWLGYLHTDNQWVAFKDVFRALELVSIYHRLYPDKPNAMLPKKRIKSAKKMAAPKCQQIWYDSLFLTEVLFPEYFFELWLFSWF